MSTRYTSVVLDRAVTNNPQDVAKATMTAIKQFSEFDVALDRMRMTWDLQEDGTVKMAFLAPDKEDIARMLSFVSA